MTNLEYRKLLCTPARARVWHRELGWVDVQGKSNAQCANFAARYWQQPEERMLRETQVSRIPQSERECRWWWGYYFPGCPAPDMEDGQWEAPEGRLPGERRPEREEHNGRS